MNWMLVKSTPFKQVCQLLFSLIVDPALIFLYEFLAFIIEILKRYTMYKTSPLAIGSFDV